MSENLKDGLIVLGYTAVVSAIAIGCTLLKVQDEFDRLAPEMFEKVRSKAYAEGYEKGSKSADWKQLALQDEKFTSRLCKAWWFDLTVKERKLN